MLDQSLSAMAAQAQPDPMVEIFRQARRQAAAYKEATGRDFVSLAAGAPDPALFPINVYQQLHQQVLDAGPAQLNYGDPQGWPELRSAWAAQLLARGLESRPNELLVTSGGMEAISLAVWLLVNPGDTVIMEGPGFAGALSMLQLFEARVVQLPCGEDGIDPAELDEAVVRTSAKLVVLMPDCQNPTGSTMPAGRRREVADVLRRRRVYAVEDGAYA